MYLEMLKTFIRTKCLCVVTQMSANGEVGTVKHVKALLRFFLLTVPRWCFFVDPLCYLRFIFIAIMLSCLFVSCSLVVTCCEGLTSWLFLSYIFLCFIQFPNLCSASGRVLNCIYS